MSTWPRTGARRRRGLLALLAAMLGLGVLLMHTQLVEALPTGLSTAASTPAAGPHHPAGMPTPAGPGSSARAHAPVTELAPSAWAAPAAQTTVAVAAELPALRRMPAMPSMPSAPSMPGMHTGGLCVAVLGSAVMLLLLVGTLLAAADPAGSSRRLAALTSSRLSRAVTPRAPWRQALTPAELCLLRT